MSLNCFKGLKKKLIEGESFSGIITEVERKKEENLLFFRVRTSDSNIRNEYCYFQGDLPKIELNQRVEVIMRKRILGFPFPYVRDKWEIPYYYEALSIKPV